MSKGIIYKFGHWFTPRVENNFRAKLLHNSGLVFLVGIFLSFQLLLRLISNSPYHILGFTSTVTIEEVVLKTNEERIKQGLPPLTYNEQLADAARRKAANMFAENYWSHNSSSGRSPWYWFDQVGYKYVHAGENLAKDFGNTDRMISAWMSSPTHRENIVSPKYRDIGVAVVPGTLQGQDTVLVVQLFGNTNSGQVTSTVAQPTLKPSPLASPTLVSPAPIQVAQVISQTKSASQEPKMNSFNLKKSAAIVTTALLMLALLLDLLVAENASLSRRVGKNLAHLIFINVILLLVTMIQAGSIL